MLAITTMGVNLFEDDVTADGKEFLVVTNCSAARRFLRR
jgi:hypothetical protein